ncbi:Inner membrane component of T3SS domain-containing protein [Neorhodopirellula lusitana]|uniref:Inner membrane component of T3SS domain-containing protein n=1 Tax=Neorhodopirellula lusitana TaxID=445327 RepID=A0ABY1QBM0_9BACT|nr:FHA domain-containing protein [Neorhodopirellula lusitana]SMP65718.1 Inner membrane component of T3SS domain-containing protein [Neorhodopirellula lusitana]
MSNVTIKVLHGADRGKLFEEISPPLTIGREEGNDIQLNDERVSRCHLKIQRDNDRLVLTDLDSTNGTKVNGSECQLKILRHGDLIAVGRSLLLLGSEEQIAERLRLMGNGGGTLNRDIKSLDESIAVDLQQEPESPLPVESLQVEELPGIPDDLSPGQKAQLCEILDFLQNRLERLIETAETDEDTEQVLLKQSAWQRLLDVQSRLATLNRSVTDPDWP